MKSKHLFFLLVCSLATACTTVPTQTPEKIAAQPTTTATITITSTAVVFPSTWTPTATLVPTLTPTITLSPTITTSPTRKPTRTQQPTIAIDPSEISLSSTIIQLSDLPAGFQEKPIDEADMQTLPLEEEGIAAIEAAFYTNDLNGSSVLSTSFAFTNAVSQAVFDRSIDDIDEIMQQEFNEMGFSEYGLEVEIEVISDFPSIGDKSVALKVIVIFDEIESYIEMALFRHDGYGGIVMISPPLMGSSSLDLAELTLLQHSRIVAFLIGGS